MRTCARLCSTWSSTAHWFDLRHTNKQQATAALMRNHSDREGCGRNRCQWLVALRRHHLAFLLLLVQHLHTRPLTHHEPCTRLYTRHLLTNCLSWCRQEATGMLPLVWQCTLSSHKHLRPPTRNQVIGIGHASHPNARSSIGILAALDVARQLGLRVCTRLVVLSLGRCD
jgi:hypothetical protein